MSLRNNMQILETNWLATTGTLSFGGGNVALANRPITFKFDGNIANASMRTRTVSLRSGKVELRDGSFLSTSQYVIDYDTGTTNMSLRLSNILIRLDPMSVDENLKILVEVYRSLPSGLDPESSRPLRTYWGNRVSDRYWYVYCPYFDNDLSYRVKLYSEVGISGNLLISDMFMGSAVAINRPVDQGLTVQRVDRSELFEAESGRRYYLQKNQYNTINSLTLSFLDRYTKEAIYNWSSRVGICKPFWIVLDPLDNWDGPSFSFTFGAYRLVELPAFSHDFLQYFSTELILEEAL